jgi:pyridoxamine 5'-phosphate oxidase
VTKEPFSQFKQWFLLAQKCGAIEDATAMCVSTLGTDGFPEGRMVLLKDFDERGFTFYTNLRSIKGRALKKTPKAALTFHWAPLKKQIRIQGTIEYVSGADADAYWNTRPRLSQLGAWASRQSEVLSNRMILLKDVAKLALKYGTGPIPRPVYWTGVRVIPRKIEFWEGQLNRLHDRFLYTRKGAGWTLARLYP